MSRTGEGQGVIRRRLPVAIKTELKRVLGAFLTARDRYAGGPQTVLLLLAHMRSGSTLLHHLLISHPEITGRGERNATYAGEQDLQRLRVDVYAHRGGLLRCHRYVTDQVNHDRFLAAEGLLNHPGVRTVFLIREPEASIASMARVLGEFYDTSAEEAVAYYGDRLATLARYARLLQTPSPAFFLTYDDLVLHTEPALQGLSAFLGLKSVLSARYRRFEFTGQRGDPSATIHSGRIVPPKRPQGIRLAPEVSSRLQAAFRDCRRALEEHCAPRPTF